MYGREEYAKQVTTGSMDFETGEYTTSDGKTWVSFGCVEFGNNNFYEIMVLKEKPTEFDESFRTNQFPVFMADHDNEMDSLGIPLPDFIAYINGDGTEHHLPTVLQELGLALTSYTK